VGSRAWDRLRKNQSALIGASLVLFVALVALLGPFAAPYPPNEQFPDGLTPEGAPVSSTSLYWLGTDGLGRDELSRLLYGGQVSLAVALTATLVALLLGVGVGLYAGWRGGLFDSVAMQLADISNSIPFLLLAIAIHRVIARPEMWTLAILLGVLSWTTLARVTRAKTVSIRELDYIHAARALGVSETAILFRHVLPNVMAPAIVLGTTLVAQMVLVESAMSFLGVGVQPPQSTWGSMLRDSEAMMTFAPQLILYPGAMILATVFGFNLLGEGLRDAFDPKMVVSAPGKNAQGFGLAALAVVGVCVFGLSTCLPPIPDHPLFDGAGAETPTRGGTFVFHHESDVRGLDPQVSYDELSGMAIKLLFEGLIDYDTELNLVPRLAEALPEISEDGLSYTFRLRTDVRFSNGRTLVAEDVRWSIEHMLHPDTGSPGVVFYNRIAGLDAFAAREAEHISGIEVLDGRTVRITLSGPDHTFLNAMAMIFAYPVPHENYEAHPDDVRRHPMGTGAFLLESWEPGVRLTFVRNPDYYLPGQPYVDRMVYELNLPRGPAFLRFQNADLDHLHRLPTTDYLWMRRQPAWEPYSSEHPLLDVWGLIMNCEVAPFDEVHVRRAVSFAVDRERWRRARANRIMVHDQPVPRSMAGYDPELPGAHYYDLDRAREEMALAGHPVRRVGDHWVAEGMDEVELWVGENETGRQYGELAQQDLAAIGIPIRLRQVAFPVQLQETGTRGRVAMVFTGWSADFPDASNFLDTLFHTRSIHETWSENRAFYSNPVIDEMLDRAHRVRTTEEREAIYREASRIIVNDAPWAFVMSQSTYEAWQPYVRGYVPNPVWSNMYRDVWLDLPRRPFREVLDPLARVRTPGAPR